MFEMFSQIGSDLKRLPKRILFSIQNEQYIFEKMPSANSNGASFVSKNKGTITGLVTDIDSGTKLAGVTVKIIETDESTLTDENGNYELATTLVGTGTMEFTLIGYQPLTNAIEIHEGGTLTQDAKLKVL